jgi:hypothetical protein
MVFIRFWICCDGGNVGGSEQSTVIVFDAETSPGSKIPLLLGSENAVYVNVPCTRTSVPVEGKVKLPLLGTINVARKRKGDCISFLVSTVFPSGNPFMILFLSSRQYFYLIYYKL